MLISTTEAKTKRLIKKVLDNEYPLDTMLAYLQPGVVKGSEAIACLKQYQTSPQKHKKRWDEIWRILKEYPKGKIPWPSQENIKEWYFMMYYFQDRFKFNKSNKMLELTSTEDITSFF